RQFRGLIGFASDRGDVPRGRREGPFNPAQNLGEVVGVPADRMGLGMGLPIQLVLGNALQHLPRVRHLPVELGQYRFGVLPTVPRRMWRMLDAVGRTTTVQSQGPPRGTEPLG